MCESETHQRKRQGEQETVGKAVDAQDDLAVPGTPCAKRGHEQPHDNGREDEVGQAQFLGNQVCERRPISPRNSMHAWRSSSPMISMRNSSILAGADLKGRGLLRARAVRFRPVDDIRFACTRPVPAG